MYRTSRGRGLGGMGAESDKTGEAICAGCRCEGLETRAFYEEVEMGGTRSSLAGARMGPTSHMLEGFGLAGRRPGQMVEAR